jgi:hypothetical protein
MMPDIHCPFLLNPIQIPRLLSICKRCTYPHSEVGGIAPVEGLLSSLTIALHFSRYDHTDGKRIHGVFSSSKPIEAVVSSHVLLMVHYLLFFWLQVNLTSKIWQGTNLGMGLN